jgi:DNA modification methylase
MTALVIRADARALPLPDASVDLIVTSPPYWALRSYTDGGQHYTGQIGDEPTPGEYVTALLDCTCEWMRVLKSTGSIFVNLGDKYATRYSSRRGEGRAGFNGDDDTRSRAGQNRTGSPEKSLLLLPERYRIGAVDRLGLTARAVLIWSKPNGLPESVTDRVRRSHEDWVHLTKAPRYFSSVDEIREPHSRVDPPRPLGTRNATQAHLAATDNVGWKDHLVAHNTLGRLPGSVWEIATQPLKVPDELAVDHFAAFPLEWPRRIIAGWSPVGICTACGEGRRPVARRTVLDAAPARRIPGTGRDPLSRHGQADAGSTLRGRHSSAITTYACACPDLTAPTRPAVVLDPFGGTGTTALVASVLGRRGVTVDRSADYCRIAAWRTTDRGERARALGLPKPPPELVGQSALFGEDVVR